VKKLKSLKINISK